VIFGNSSIQQNIRVVGFEPGREIRKRFAGPRFGIEGVRARTGRARGGLISPVIKPQGSSVSALADIARRCTLGGADIIKDDHGLANQRMAPFRERVTGGQRRGGRGKCQIRWLGVLFRQCHRPQRLSGG
jgi:ribulose-bisphosphate carboxylase large chain